MVFQFLALVILILFYGIYVGKMIQQRKQGIKTDQMAFGRKDFKLFLNELFLKIMSCGIIILELFFILQNNAYFFNFVRWGGVILGFIGVLLFLLSVKTMDSSWRAGIPEKDEIKIIIYGIYSFSRNPAFLGFYFVYIAILLLFFDFVLLIFTLLTIILFHLQILQEEKYLANVFGEEYRDYSKRVRRYF